MKQLLCNSITTFCVIVALWLAGCQNTPQLVHDSEWTEIIIKLDSQMIDIANTPKQSGWNRIHLATAKDTVERITLTREQLDSIYNYVNALITHPPAYDHIVTVESAENASFVIISSKDVARSTRTTTSKEIEFHFVESWKGLSEDTKRLYAVLTRDELIK